MSKAISRPGTGDLVDHALSLIAAADVERPEKAARIRGELERWRRESPVHKTAYEEALRRWNALGNALPEVRAHFDAGKTKPRRIGARGMLCVAALIAAVGLAIKWRLQQPLFEQTFQTGTAQIAKLSLPDASRIDLNAQSALRVRLYRDRRIIELTAGEARFEVTQDANKPFQVQTRSGIVEVIGTVFTVGDRGNRIVIEVEQGRVRFSPRGENSSIGLTGGERLLARENAAVKIQHYDANVHAEWRDGWLVFDNEPLADALLSINPYRNTPIRLADDKAGLLRLTGRFRPGDSQLLLAALPKILPIEIKEQSDGSVEIRHR
jgi:transmembrane sensor